MRRPSPVRDQVRALLCDQVRALLLSGTRHAWSLEELLGPVRASMPSVNYSSVLRAVQLFEREGLVQRVEVGDGKARFEPNSNHHDHVRCEGCGRLVEVEGDCLVGQMERKIAAMTGFAVSGHSLVFTGTCPECKRAG